MCSGLLTTDLKFNGLPRLASTFWVQFSVFWTLQGSTPQVIPCFSTLLTAIKEDLDTSSPCCGGWWFYSTTLLETNISPIKHHFWVDDFPFSRWDMLVCSRVYSWFRFVWVDNVGPLLFFHRWFLIWIDLLQPIHDLTDLPEDSFGVQPVRFKMANTQYTIHNKDFPLPRETLEDSMPPNTSYCWWKKS